MREFTTEKEDKNVRLDMFLLEKLQDKTRSSIKKMIEEGDVTVNGKKVKAGYSLAIGESISVKNIESKQTDAVAQDIPLDIIYEDNDFAVINKPQGMVVHPSVGNYTGTLVNALLYNVDSLSSINGAVRPGIVHRLDKDTSGLIVIAKNDKAHMHLSKQIADKTCRRIYIALLDGTLKELKGEVENYIGTDPKKPLRKTVLTNGKGKYAKTYFEVLKYYRGYTLAKFELSTGRTHQIRVHSRFLHRPIVGDKLYNFNKPKFKLKGQLLHATELVLVHPTTNKEMKFTCDLPEYFSKILASLQEI